MLHVVVISAPEHVCHIFRPCAVVLRSTHVYVQAEPTYADALHRATKRGRDLTAAQSTSSAVQLDTDSESDFDL